MSFPIVKKVLIKASTDADFRYKFINETDTLLSKYDLTEEEKQCLKENANEESLKKVVFEIEKEMKYSASDIRL